VHRMCTSDARHDAGLGASNSIGLLTVRPVGEAVTGEPVQTLLSVQRLVHLRVFRCRCGLGCWEEVVHVWR
jgi:hypothetical protein